MAICWSFDQWFFDSVEGKYKTFQKNKRLVSIEFMDVFEFFGCLLILNQTSWTKETAEEFEAYSETRNSESLIAGDSGSQSSDFTNNDNTSPHIENKKIQHIFQLMRKE